MGSWVREMRGEALAEGLKGSEEMVWDVNARRESLWRRGGEMGGCGLVGRRRGARGIRGWGVEGGGGGE